MQIPLKNSSYFSNDINYEEKETIATFRDINDDKYILEIKTLNAIPLWLVNELNELQIVPGSFSKYGTAYEKFILEPVVVESKPQYQKADKEIKSYIRSSAQRVPCAS